MPNDTERTSDGDVADRLIVSDKERIEVLGQIKTNTAETAEATAVLGDIKDNTGETADSTAVLGKIEQNTGDTATAAARTAAAATATADALSDRADTVRERRATKPIVTTTEGKLVAAPTSTEEEDRNTAGQRAINAVWENTQRFIAIMGIGVAILTSAYLSIVGPDDSKNGASVFLYGVANLIAGFYFGRTNHTRVGGVSSPNSR